MALLGFVVFSSNGIPVERMRDAVKMARSKQYSMCISISDKFEVRRGPYRTLLLILNHKFSYFTIRVC